MRYLFCPNCGVRYAEKEKAIFYCFSCEKTLWLNSKPTASTIIVDGKKILLGKREYEPSKGKWDVIGGFLQYREHSEAGAKREAKEETGLDIKLVDFLGVFMDEYGEDKEATLNICYVAVVIGGTESPSDDIAELQWFDQSEIPENLAFENGRQMIEAWKQNVIKGLEKRTLDLLS